MSCHVMNMPHNSFIAESMVTYMCMCSQGWARNYALFLIATMAMSCHAPTIATQLVQKVCGCCDLRLCCVCMHGWIWTIKFLACCICLSEPTLCIQSCTILDSDTSVETRGRLRSADSQCKPPSSDRLDTLALYYNPPSLSTCTHRTLMSIFC